MSQEAAASALPTPDETPPPEKPLQLPHAMHQPAKLYRVQRSAALDARGVELFPGSTTQDHQMFGVNAGCIFPPTYEGRINKESVERALDPLNKVPTGLIALYADKYKAIDDFEFYHSQGCDDVYIIHISMENFSRGMVSMTVRPHGEEKNRRIRLPVLGVRHPNLFVFPALAVVDVFKIESATCAKGVWFAADVIPANYIVRREARQIEADWSGRDERWNLWPGLEHLDGRRSMNELGVMNDPPTPLAPRSPSPPPLSLTPEASEAGTGLDSGSSATAEASEAGTGLDSGSSATEGGDDDAGLLSVENVGFEMAGVAGSSELGVGIPDGDASPETLVESPDTVMSSPTLLVLSPTMGSWLHDPVEGSP